MPPQNNLTPGNTPEIPVVPTPEAIKPVEAAPELAPTVEKPGMPVPDEVVPAAPEVVAVPQAPVEAAPAPDATAIEEAEQSEVDIKKPIDNAWVEAVDGVIKKDVGKPFEEENDATSLNDRFLGKQYGKEIEEDKAA